MLVPNTPMGFSLPAQAVLGTAVPGAFGPEGPGAPFSIPSCFPNVLSRSSVGMGSSMGTGSPSAPSDTTSISPRACPSWRAAWVEPTAPSPEGCIFCWLKLAGRFLYYLLCYFCSHVCCNMQGEAQNCQAL